MKQKNLLTKCAPGHTLSVLKPISIVVKWWCVVSVLSPLASKSYGGSQILNSGGGSPPPTMKKNGVYELLFLELPEITSDTSSMHN